MNVCGAHYSLVICEQNFFRNVLGQMAAAMPQAVTVTPEEREAIERVSTFLCINVIDEFLLCQ